MQERETIKTVDYTEEYPKFTQDMKETYTILVPDMLPYHFDIICHVVEKRGYHMEVLKNDSRAMIDEDSNTCITIPAIPRFASSVNISTP